MASAQTTIHPLIAIKNPHKKGEKILIAEHEFNSKEHELFEKGAAPAKEPGKEHDPLDFSAIKDVAGLKAFAAANQIALGNANSKAAILKILETWKETHGVGQGE